MSDPDVPSSSTGVTNEGKSPADSKKARLTKKIHIAVAGCSHGEMDKIYSTLAEIERSQGYKFDLLIGCGDYQAVRNYGDLKHLHCPEKYRALNTFYRYYSGEMVAPILTIFVGGNHEASGFMQELPYGGWVAPRIYYMGHSSVIQFAGLRIAGLSGIYNCNHYDMGHWERPPFTDYGAVVSVYHVRAIDAFRLKQLRTADDIKGPQIDIMVTHDWPSGITDFGDLKGLLKIKPVFREDLKKNALGNPATMGLLHEVRPRFWFSAHLHCFFAALVPHQKGKHDAVEPEPTRFMALDKPLPKRHFLQALELDVDSDAELKLSYDPTWLAILKLTDGFTNASKGRSYLPSQFGSLGERWDYRPSVEDIEKVNKCFDGGFVIPENFRKTAPPHQNHQTFDMPSELYYRNPQTSEFCAKLGIRDLNAMLCAISKDDLGIPHFLISEETKADDTAEILLDDDEKFDADSDFIIDRGPYAEQHHLNDFVAPKLRETKKDDCCIEEPETLVTLNTITDSNQEEDLKERRTVGSGVFKRRPVDFTEDD